MTLFRHLVAGILGKNSRWKLLNLAKLANLAKWPISPIAKLAHLAKVANLPN